MMNTNHLEGRVCSTDYVGIDTYLSCWILWATLRELFRTYPASSRNRKMIFQKGGDILVPGRVVLNSSYKVLEMKTAQGPKLEGKKSTTQLYHLESRWRSPRKHRLPSKCMRPLDLWTPAPPRRIQWIQGANSFQVIEWPRTSSPPWFGK